VTERSDSVPGTTANRVTARFAVVLTAIAFLLHYAWENAQCATYFIHSDETPTQLEMVRATVGDVALTWIAFAAVAGASGRRDWVGRRWSLRQWGTLVSAGLVMSIAVEAYALSSGRWSYTPNNPRIPGLGVSLLPVAQLALLFPVTFTLAEWILRRRGTLVERGPGSVRTGDARIRRRHD
jgi:hypothetical protein